MILFGQSINNNYISAFFSLLFIPLFYWAFNADRLFVAIFPVFLMFVTVLLFFPRIIPVVFIISNFYGGYIYNSGMIAVTITDSFFMIFLFSAVPIFFNKPIYKNDDMNAIYGFLILFSFLSFFSILLNFPFHTSRFNTYAIWYLYKMMQLFLIVTIVLKLPSTKEFLEKLITVTITFSLLQIPIAFFQYMSMKSIGFENMRMNVHGTFSDHHSMLGSFLLIPLSFSLYRFQVIQNKGRKITFLIISILFVYTIIISGSRSALLGLLAAISLFTLKNLKINKTVIIYLLLFIIIATFLYNFSPLGQVFELTFKSKETDSLDLSSASRFLIWKGAIDHFISLGLWQKIFGIGIGTFNSIEYNYVIWGTSKSPTGAHNNALHVLLEIGILGLVSFIGLFYTILKQLYRSYKNKLSINYFYATIALLISGVAQETFWFQGVFGNLWLFYLFFLTLIIKHSKEVINV